MKTPRSYVVHTPSGQLRRNSRHLVPVPEERTAREKLLSKGGQHLRLSKPTTSTTDQLPSVCSPIMTQQRSGIKINPPLRYREDNCTTWTWKRSCDIIVCVFVDV